MVKWNAYYFETLNDTSPARMTTIQADDEDEAGKIAIAQMGRCMRVPCHPPGMGRAKSTLRGTRPEPGRRASDLNEDRRMNKAPTPVAQC